MKRLLFVVIWSLLSLNMINAQFTANDAMYVTAEFNMGNYFGGDLNLNYVLNDKYTFKAGYTGNMRKAKSRPEDFTTGVVGILVWGANYPFDKYENFGVSAGRIIKMNQTGNIRMNLSFGVGYTIYTEPENWKKINDNFVSIKENYSYDHVKHHTVSLIVNPKIEFLLTKYFGLTVSPMLQVNKDRTYFGIGVGSMIGLLHR